MHIRHRCGGSWCQNKFHGIYSDGDPERASNGIQLTHRAKIIYSDARPPRDRFTIVFSLLHPHTCALQLIHVSKNNITLHQNKFEFILTVENTIVNLSRGSHDRVRSLPMRSHTSSYYFCHVDQL